jgi:hypothetical protein
VVVVAVAATAVATLIEHTSNRVFQKASSEAFFMACALCGSALGL